MFATRSRPTARHNADSQQGKKPCKFCQRSRWLMSLTILAMLLSVTLLNHSG